MQNDALANLADEEGKSKVDFFEHSRFPCQRKKERTNAVNMNTDSVTLTVLIPREHRTLPAPDCNRLQ